MFGINGKPYANLDPYVDIQSLVDLKPLIAFGLAKCSEYKISGTIGDQRHLFDQTKTAVTPAVRKVINDKSYPYKDLLKELNDYDKIVIFCKYMHDITTLGEVIPLRRYTDPKYEKHRAVSSTNSQCYEYFKPLHDWLESQNIFDEIGRMLIFINEPGNYGPLHTDQADHKSKKEPFIWINIDNRKKFWIMDLDTDTRHDVSANVITFESADWHGSDPTEYVGWSLRVDGVFSKEFLTKSGLDQWITYEDQFN